MTNDEVRRAQQRIADQREQRRAGLAPSAPSTAAPANGVGGPFVVGDRVMDLRGGREGVVYALRSSGQDSAASVSIQFDDGSFGWRDPLDLLARPRRPGAGA